MSDCDFEDGELLDQSDNLLTEAEFFGYQTPKGRQILLTIGSEKALTILINSPATTLEEALKLTEELLEKNAHADTELFAQALMDKGLTFEQLEQNKFLRNQLDVLLAFIERAIEQRNIEASMKALRLINTTHEWRLDDRHLADLLYAVYQTDRLLAENSECSGADSQTPSLDLWILELTTQIVDHKPNLALLKSKKAAAINEIVISYCICVENYEAAWSFLVDYLSASKRIDSHAQPIINLVYALEILKPRNIDLKQLLNSEPVLSGDIGLITKLLDRPPTEMSVLDKLTVIRTRIKSKDPVLMCVKTAALKSLMTDYLQMICAQVAQGQEFDIAKLEEELDTPLHEFAKYLTLDTQIVYGKLMRKCEVLELEMQAFLLLSQRVEAMLRRFGNNR